MQAQAALGDPQLSKIAPEGAGIPRKNGLSKDVAKDVPKESRYVPAN